MLAQAQAALRAGAPLQALARLDAALHPAAAEDSPADPFSRGQWLLLRSLCLQALGRDAEALQAWREAERLQPGDASSLHAWGLMLARHGQTAAALQLYDQALQVAPGDVPTLADRTVVLSQLGRLPQALHSAQRARALAPDHAVAWNNEAAVQLQLLQADPALAAATQAVRCAPQDAGTAAQVSRHAQALAESRPVAVPFGLMALVDDGALQRRAGALWVRHVAGVVAALAGPRWPAGAAAQRCAGPWRVGWLSADFHAHPTARLLAGMFEAQDAQAFEHHALSITPALA